MVAPGIVVPVIVPIVIVALALASAPTFVVAAPIVVPPIIVRPASPTLVPPWLVVPLLSGPSLTAPSQFIAPPFLSVAHIALLRLVTPAPLWLLAPKHVKHSVSKHLSDASTIVCGRAGVIPPSLSQPGREVVGVGGWFQAAAGP